MSDTEVQGWSKALGGIIPVVGGPVSKGFEGVLSGSIVGT